jgi:uncharacterized protein (DUF2267 family)
MAVDYQDFISTVEREAGLRDDSDAERAVRATLETLAERLSGGEADDIRHRLPPEIRPMMHDGASAEPFGLEDFLRRVAERERVDPGTAQRHARAVFAALGRAIGHDELHDMASELPKDFEPLLQAAEPPPPSKAPAPTDVFLEKVGRRAVLDRDSALRVTEAVLEALGQRITRGEIEDLLPWLPAELHVPLRRGDEASHGAARPLSLEEFERYVAERAGISRDEARRQARAVFATLRESIDDKEFDDMVAQLPREYSVLLARD